jgi:hypothetical protein
VSGKNAEQVAVDESCVGEQKTIQLLSQSVYWRKFSRPGGGNIIFEKRANLVVGPQQSRRFAYINQRVKSAIGTAEKNERDLRSKKREKRLRPLGRPSG